MMKVDPSETPTTYRRVQSVFAQNHISALRNITDEGDAYFHICRIPDLSNIESPDDIETLEAYYVEDDESVEEVKATVVESAKEYLN